MDASIRKGWFTEHRGWEDVFSAACGVLIVLSPGWILRRRAPPSSSAGLAGVIITMLTMLELMDHQRWEELAEFACGLWVVVSPLVFGYDGALRLSHYLLGAAVAVLALLELGKDSRRQVAA